MKDNIQQAKVLQFELNSHCWLAETWTQICNCILITPALVLGLECKIGPLKVLQTI